MDTVAMPPDQPDEAVERGKLLRFVRLYCKPCPMCHAKTRRCWVCDGTGIAPEAVRQVETLIAAAEQRGAERERERSAAECLRIAEDCREQAASSITTVERASWAWSSATAVECADAVRALR